MDLQKCMTEYADLIVLGGIRLKEGESVLIHAEAPMQDMVLKIVASCYQHGAKKVEVKWMDPALDALHYQYASLDSLSKIEAWQEERLALQAKELPCVIHLIAANPQDYTEEMLSKQRQASLAKMDTNMKYSTMMQDKYKWTAAGVPTPTWAKLVYPHSKDALERLWKDVLQSVLVEGDGTSIQKWEDKWNKAWAHMDQLNHYHFRSLHIQTGLGTDLKVKLHEKARFLAAAYREEGYVANLPSEELYTSPIAGEAEGKIVASCPLLYDDHYVDGLVLTFKDGKVIDVKAKQGEAFMDALVNMDEGASMIGEFAIVDKNSPIKKLGHLMYHTLYDENAACHIAIGKGFNFVIEGYKDMNEAELKACGINTSYIHCDIMIGTDDTFIVGTTKDGQEVTIMQNGSFVL